MSFRWYVVQTYSNYEKRVQAAIKEQIILQNLAATVEKVLIPTEEIIEIKKGEKKKSERKFFPGYVLLYADMTDEVWHMVNNVPKVTGFVGSGKGSKPLPISEKEAVLILKQMEDGVERPRSSINIDIGESVRVIDGPFASFQGVVEEIDVDKSKVKVSVSIFGRPTPIELDFTQVERA